jgi:hypothetical protein
MVLDVTELDFCYSECIRALLTFSTESYNRPPLHVMISNATWQVTSLRAMAGFCPNCTIGTSLYGDRCCSGLTRTDEDQFFAPTGSGSIVTKVVCCDCGKVLSESQERFD